MVVLRRDHFFFFFLIAFLSEKGLTPPSPQHTKKIATHGAHSFILVFLNVDPSVHEKQVASPASTSIPLIIASHISTTSTRLMLVFNCKMNYIFSYSCFKENSFNRRKKYKTTLITFTQENYDLITKIILL